LVSAARRRQSPRFGQLPHPASLALEADRENHPRIRVGQRFVLELTEQDELMRQMVV